MQNIGRVAAKFREAGFNITNQRLSIFGFLKDNKDHPSAEKIYDEIRKIHPSISVTTVYKTLQAMKNMGEIQELTIAKQKVHYDPNTCEHIHIFCERCGTIEDLIWSDFMLRNIRAFGFGKLPFEVQRVQLYLVGLCNNCRQKGSKKVESNASF